MTKAAVGVCDLAQARRLSALVEVEARWENLRKTPSRPKEPDGIKEDLEGRQKAYEIYRARLAAYNNQYAPAHLPELLLNTPTRLGKWCQTMRDLYVLVEHDPQSQCPVQLIEKAYRCADRIAIRMNKNGVNRSTAPDTIRAAILSLDAVCQWCANLNGEPPPGLGA